MDFEDIIIPLIIGLFFSLIIVNSARENEKEIEIIKKTKDFVIHENCKEFEEVWYCYD